MSVAVSGFASGSVLEQLREALTALPAQERQRIVKSVRGVFEIAVKAKDGKTQSWTLDFKGDGNVLVGKPPGKPDITIATSDETFVDLAAGRTTGQKAFMTGKIKVQGNVMLATKLDGVLKLASKSAKPTASTSGNASTASAGAKPASVAVSGYASSQVFEEIAAGLASASPEVRTRVQKQIKAVFQLDIKGPNNKIQSWFLDLKDSMAVQTTPTATKPTIVITIADKDFVDLAGGKLTGQKAFMTGKLKIKGNPMLATKLDTVFRDLRPKAKM